MSAKRWIGIGCGLLLVCAVFFLGYIVGQSQLLLVRVTIVNQSGKQIDRIELDHGRGVERIDRLAAGESRTVLFYCPSETSYALRVRFADGTEISGGGDYAEAGYRFTEKIGSSRIETEHSFFPW